MKKLLLIMLLASTICTHAQQKLYPNEFELSQVKLLDGPFKHAQDLNIKTLLEYDVNRLLEPFFTQAGLETDAEQYANWTGLAGHVGGHYLSAMAINYAATGNATCKSRMDYMLSELKKCQDANGNGYLGGVPRGKELWSALKKGDFSIYNRSWAPWYNVHKIFAGLRDAWVYGNSELAKEMYLDICDWSIDLTSGLSHEQMQEMLSREFGGMNEVIADAYKVSGDTKYLDAAKRFTHDMIFDSMLAGVDNLDNLHANTQVPKIAGFARVAKLGNDKDYEKAADFFWQTVVDNRTLAFGGNSVRERFPTTDDCVDFTIDREGPETCNTYNMLKVTEHLFSVNPDAKYSDYYEQALYNHILSTQHPEQGGYVYFTPVRPRHYRVYSEPNEGMWCCVGTGMENHSKYSEFIYTHNNDNLYVNLFIASVLDWPEKGIKVTQKTNFPDEEATQLTIETENPVQLKLMLRHPEWVGKDEFEVRINNVRYEQNSAPGTYLAIDRAWKNGDVVSVKLPMHTSIVELTNVDEYVAFRHGPIVLGAKTGEEDMIGLIGDDSRWGHVAHGEMLPLDEAPIIISERNKINDEIVPVANKPLTFKLANLLPKQPEYASLVLEPFYRIHDSRYMLYWMALNENEYANRMESLKAEEDKRIKLDNRTVDRVAPGEQQPETDHNLQSKNSNTGDFKDKFWRDANNAGFFSYEMDTKGRTDLKLMVRYWGNGQIDRYGARNSSFDILVDNELIATEEITNEWKEDEFVNIEYPIKKELLEGKENVLVKFQAKPNSGTTKIFYVRLVHPE